jgi:hypothetical protein
MVKLIDNGVIDTTLSFILLACGGGMYNRMWWLQVVW